MTSRAEQLLSEFVDAWNAGQRPDVDDYLVRADESERAELAEQLMAFLSFAPTPAYSDEALAAIRAEPVVAEALAASSEGARLFPALLARLRTRFEMSTNDVAGELVTQLDLRKDQQAKTAGYLERLEEGELEPTRVSRRVFDALARMFRLPREQLEGAADMSAWARSAAAPAPVFRADKEATADVSRHLEVLADALEAPGAGGRDEVDELFLGGR